MNWKIQTCSASGSIPPDTRLAVVGSKPIQPDKYIVWSTITAWLSYISKYSYNFNNTVTYYAPTPRVGGIVIMCIWRLSRRSGLSREQSQWAGGLPSGNLQGWGNIVAASAQLVNAVPNIHWLTCCTVDSGHKNMNIQVIIWQWSELLFHSSHCFAKTEIYSQSPCITKQMAIILNLVTVGHAVQSYIGGPQNLGNCSLAIGA